MDPKQVFSPANLRAGPQPTPQLKIARQPFPHIRKVKRILMSIPKLKGQKKRFSLLPQNGKYLVQLPKSHIRGATHTSLINVFLLESQYYGAVKCASWSKPRGISGIVAAADQPIAVVEHRVGHGNIAEPRVPCVGHRDAIRERIPSVREERVEAARSRDVGDAFQDLYPGLSRKGHVGRRDGGNV